MRTCCNCGRPIGEAFERGECPYPGGFACGESSSHELRRELADAKSEAQQFLDERIEWQLRAGRAENEAKQLRIDLDESRQVHDRDIAALHAAQARIVELETAFATARGAQAEEPMAHRTDEELESMWDHADGGVAGSNRALYELGRADARREVDELRRVLGCAPNETMLEAAKRMRAEVEEYMAEESRRIQEFTCSKPEPPIESLGPVPAEEWRVDTWGDGLGSADGMSRMRKAVAWLIRDAVRRGAKLEGDDR